MSIIGVWGFLLIAVAIGILGIVGLWKVFRKAGMPGWLSLIPIYNIWAWGVAVFSNRKKAVVWVVVSALFILIAFTGFEKSFTYDSGGGLLNGTGSSTILQLGFLGFVGLITQIVLIIMQVLASASTARSFGKGAGFAIGLFFLTPLFLFALGISDASYLGPDSSLRGAIPMSATVSEQSDYDPDPTQQMPPQTTYGPGMTQEMPRQP